jgi:putative membrane protein
VILSTLPAFAAYLALSAAVLAAFVAVYLRFTPYREVALVREGNAAAAVSLAGAMLGYALPVASAVRNSRDLAEAAVWSVVACLVQLAAYLVARRLLPRLGQQIAAGEVAPAVVVAALAVSMGLLNAACMES